MGRIARMVIAVAVIATVLLHAEAAARQQNGDPLERQAFQNRLPISEDAELTPRQFLWLTEPELAPVLDRIAECESDWRMIPNSSGASSAYGYFQIIRGTAAITPQFAEGRTRTDPQANVEMAIWLAKRDGVMAHWFPSAKCWLR